MFHQTNTSLPVRRITPSDSHYFFGYYDLQPFNSSQTLHLVHKASFMDRLQFGGDKAEVGVIDYESGKYEKLADTQGWNFQQGAMLQWNPQASGREIIYNDIVDGSAVGVIMDIHTGKKRYLDRAVANVSQDGKYALSINMSRLYDFRPGYGYAAPPDRFYYKNHAKDDGIFLIDMEKGTSRLILSLDEIWEFSGNFFGKDEKIIVNHITFNPDASRFLCLVRNFHRPGTRHDTALITADRDGGNLYLLSDYGVQSHYYWMDKKHIAIYSDGKELDCSRGWANNYILEDQTDKGQIMADGFFVFDNHMSFSPDREYMLTDTYPDNKRMQTLMIYWPRKNLCSDLGKFYSLPLEPIDIRCDLHPRFSTKGDIITFDSTHEGFRGVYAIDFNQEAREKLFAK